MKKIFCVLLSVFLLLSFSMVALAENNEDATAQSEEEVILFSASDETDAPLLGSSPEGSEESKDDVLVLSPENGDGDPVLTIGASPALIVDNAGLLTEDEVSQLSEEALRISDAYDMDVAVYTVSTLDGKDPMDAADDFFDYNGYGRGEDRSGIMFFLAMESRDWWVTTRGRGIDVFNDGTIEYIFDNMSSSLSGGNYYFAFSSYLSDCEECLRAENRGEAIPGEDIPYDPTPYDPSQNAPVVERRNGALSPIAIVLALVVGFLLSMIPLGSMKKQINNVAFQSSASGYTRKDSLHIRNSRDIFLYQNVTKTPIPHDDSSSSSHSSGGRSGGGIHVSSSGATHGGHGGKF